MSKFPSWYSLQNSSLGPLLTRQVGIPAPRPNEVLLQIVCGSVCTADHRVIARLKAVKGSINYVQLGHEGWGIIVVAGKNFRHLVGKPAVLLPHIREENHTCDNCRTGKEYRCRVAHAGFDADGTFGDYLVAPAQNVKVLPNEVLRAAREAEDRTGRPWPTVLSLIEPWSTVLTGCDIVSQVDKTMNGSHLLSKIERGAARALLLGCGPMGGMWGLQLAARHYKVEMFDIDTNRSGLLHKQLGRRSRIFVPRQSTPGFDLVVVCTSSPAAVKDAFRYIGDRGLIYFFSGINNAKIRRVTSPGGIINIEELHREGGAAAVQLRDGRRVFNAGHSGYTKTAFERAVYSIKENACGLASLITGVVRGFNGDTVESLIPEVDDYTTPATPVLLSVLKGDWGKKGQEHLKISILSTLHRPVGGAES